MSPNKRKPQNRIYVENLIPTRDMNYGI